MKNIRLGIFGLGRGGSFYDSILVNNGEVVAVCDGNPEKLKQADEALKGKAALYSDFDEFIKHDMDAVVLANYFHEHTPYAIKCFEKGLHVFSECISNGTMAEGVELLRAFEKSKSIYMLAENYPQMLFNKEMKEVCDTGSLGKILYAEGEYNHPANPKDAGFTKLYNYFLGHWRNYLPATYYITHSLGPVMSATGATPKRVTAMATFCPPEKGTARASHCADKAAIITTQNDDGSIFRVTGCASFGAHHNAYRICGTKGQIENVRGANGKIMLRYNDWEKPEGKEEINYYDPQWNDKDEELIKQAGKEE